MGKSGGRRKKAVDSNKSPVKNSSNAVAEPDSSTSTSTSTPLKRSHVFKLKEEGNTSFQNNDNAHHHRLSRQRPKKPEPVLPPEPKPKPKPNPSNENQKQQVVTIVCRPLKLVYDHDIRLAEIPTNSSFRVLRETVRKRFPTSSSVLIKYKDNDGDLVTITSTDELRLAESTVDKDDSFGMLKLFIVDVSPFEEPPFFEEQEQEKKDKKEKSIDCFECGLDNKVENQHKVSGECKAVEMDDWLFEFAKLFRSHIGIESIDAHVDLHEIGMEFCSDALEEVVTTDEAQGLFDTAALKFQEVAALAFFNWGNVHMCSARKRDEKEGIGMGIEEYDWVKEKYYLAREKYEQALVIKPDLYEGFLALGQQQFELAKLHWSFGLAENIDLSKETLELFNGAEEKMKAATDMWEKVEAMRASGSKKEEKLADQGTVMGTQIHLFMGNMLFERSQVECKLGINDWKRNLSAAVKRFRLAGASEADISTIMKKHSSNENAKEGEAKGSRIHK